MKHHVHSQRDLEEKRDWYSPAAAEYDRFRPKYPEKIVQRACEIAGLPPIADLLEIGAGPGTATVSFAGRGHRIVSLEPSRALYELAQKNCAGFAKVEMVNTTFEEYEVQEGSFDAVLAPTSIHWVSPELAYRKSSRALRPNGSLMLLWNMPLRPSFKAHQDFEGLYKKICPEMSGYHDNDDLRGQIGELGENLENSDLFCNMRYEDQEYSLVYSGSEYVRYLNTMSNYLKLEEPVKKKLFSALKEKIAQVYGDKIEVFGLCALQVAEKRDA